MIPFAFLMMQTQTVRLTPFVDDGQTKTHPVPPILVPIVSVGGKRIATARVGSKAVRIWIQDSGGKRAFFVDRNGNGRFEASERTVMDEQRDRLPDGSVISIFAGPISLGSNVRHLTQSFLSKSKDKDFLRAKDKLVLRPMSGYVGQATFGGKRVRIGIRGSDPKNAALFVDRDGDGVLGTVPMEMFRLDQPFNLGGRTYKLATFNAGGQPTVAFATSAKKVAEIPMPADLRVGKIAPTLTGKTLGGKTVSFPKGFPGKVLLLDVWATWCGPCVAEIPFMKAAYAKYRKRGFEVVSYSIDDPGTQARVAAFVREKGTNWTQVFEGLGWESPVCRKYNITGIPFLLLVDGSTGRILATEGSLRGPNLDATVAGALAARGR